eukprot:TRINITY_DN4663_c0_g2_i3.p2 TRINITY_DN4663_c0_g2~~TRINITY_DN4663_c0_g2_i3.p2  ORF type:complete len:366 (+),score=29.26 TRINITY_DN4663_c0_g2_i3:198-1295(+)
MVSWGFSVFTICTYVHFGLGARTDSRMVQLAEEAADVTLARARSSSQNPLNIAEAEEKLRNESPQLLTEGEHVEMAIKKSRGVVYFTNIRVLVHKNGHGVNRNKTTYRSLPYKSVKTFAVQTGGEIKTRRWLLGSTVLKPYKPRIDLYTSMPTLQVFSLSFHKDAVNIFEIGNFFASKIFDLEMPPPASSSSSAGTDAELFKRQKVGMGDLVAMAGGDAEQIDAREFEERLRANASALGIDETVELAFQVGRTATLLTSRRILRVRWHRSRRATSYLSIPYEAIQVFRVSFAGSRDVDSNFEVWMNLPGFTHHFSQRVRKDSGCESYPSSFIKQRLRSCAYRRACAKLFYTIIFSGRRSSRSIAC